MMLARVADSLYWIGRYVERAEHLCRALATSCSTPRWTAPTPPCRPPASPWPRWATRTSRRADAVTPSTRPRPWCFDRDDAGSVVVSLARARENARQVRDQITTETWERLNLLYLRVTGAARRAAPSTRRRPAFLHEIIADLHLFKGAADATMSHGEGWRFLLLGVYLERAQLIARLLEVCFGDGEASALDDHFAP